MRLFVFTLVISLVTAFHTLIPPQANAESALFRVKQSWMGLYGTTFGAVTYTSPDYHPPTTGPGKAPPATGCVGSCGTTTPWRFTVPSKVIKSYGTRTCFPLGCNPPEISTVFNSYWNAKATFQKSRPNAPTTTVTLRFATTMGNPFPAPWTGEPVSPTTQFSGNYDFSRSGTIRIVPGPNRFGGTLRMLAGANHLNVRSIPPRYITTGPTRQYGAGTALLLDTMNIPLTAAYRYKLTPSGYNKLTTGTTFSPGDYYKQKVVYRHSPPSYALSLMHLTTGRLNIQQSVHWCAKHFCSTSPTSISVSGYDNRTPNGLSGNISLVRPRLVHSYVVPHDPNLPIRKERTFARIDRITVTFLPEPGSMALLTAGVMCLMGLYCFRKP